MLKIRLQRTGRINNPAFRIVVIEDSRSTKAGNIVEQVGTYNPKSKERTLKEDRVKYWMSVGAQASGTVHNMLVTMGIVKGKKINVLPKKTVAKVEVPAAAAESSSEPKVEAAPAVAEAPVVAEVAAEEAAPAEVAAEEPAKEEAAA